MPIRSGRDKLTNVSPTSDTPTPVLQVTVTNIAVRRRRCCCIPGAVQAAVGLPSWCGAGGGFERTATSDALSLCPTGA